MQRLIVVAAASIGFVLSVASSTAAMASAQRTFVASYGNDANPCSLTLPCRSFAAALGQTAPVGEVIVLDSAGYGSVVIAQSAAIIAPPGVYAGVTVTGSIGIAIDAPGVVVVLRGLSINGQGGNVGVAFLHGAKRTVEDSEIANIVTAGIVGSYDGGDLIVRNTVIRNASTCIDTGIHDSVLDGVRLENCSGVGILAGGSNVTITNSVLANNPVMGVLASAQVFGSSVNVMVSHSSISGSADAFVAAAATSASATLIADGNTINNASHAAFLLSTGTATIYSSGTNAVGTNVAAVVSGGAITLIGLH